MPPIDNPYPLPKIGGKHAHHRVTARVSEEDYVFVKRLFPFIGGVSDKILSILWKKLVDELRKEHEREPFTVELFGNTDFGTDPTYRRIESVITEFQRCTVGHVVGPERPRDVDGTTSGVRKTVRRSPKQRGDKKSGDSC